MRDVRVFTSPVAAKIVIVSLSNDGFLDSYVCTTDCSTPASWTVTNNIVDLWTVEPVTPDRPFDAGFEHTSGDLILVYDRVSVVSGEELFTRTMTSASTAFGSETAINTASPDSIVDRIYPFVRLSSQIGTDKIGSVQLDFTNLDVDAMIWSGSAWGDHAIVSTDPVSTNEEQIGIGWERNSGHLLAVGGSGADIAYREFTTSWQTAANVGGVATGVGNMNWIILKSSALSTSNVMYMAFVGVLADLASIQWSGTAWGTGTEHDAAAESVPSRNFDIAMSNDADDDGANIDALLMWSTTTDLLSYRSWSASNTYGTEGTIANLGTHIWITFPFIPNPTAADDVEAVGVVRDSAFDLSRLQWTGGSNAPTDGEDEITTVVGGGNEPEKYSIAFIISTGAVNFDRALSSAFTTTAVVDIDFGAVRQIAEALNIADVVEVASGIIRAISDTLNIEDLAERAGTFARSIVASLGLEDVVGIGDVVIIVAGTELNLASVLLVFIAPLLLLFWALKFKGYLSLIAIAPLLLIMLAVLLLNANPTITFEVVDRQCAPFIANSTTTTTNATTFTDYNSQLVCNEETLIVPFVLNPTALTLMNILMTAIILSISFVVIRRTIIDLSKKQDSD